MNCTPIEACLCCGQAGPRSFLDFGARPLANSLRAPADGAEAQYPLAVAECRACRHWQLTHAVDPAALFPSDYPYRSGTTVSTRKHFAHLATDCFGRLPVGRRRALDVACNDGALMDALAARCFVTHGVDPAPQTTNPNVVRAPWDETGAGFADGSFDLITALNVLAHVPDPCAFLCGVRRVLKPDGWACVEVTDGEEMARSGNWDVVYHEHLSYFRQNGLRVLADRAGMIVDTVERLAVHGGSVRAWLRRPPPSAGEFVTITAARTAAFREALERAPRPWIGLGCPAKAALLLGHTDVRLDWIADATPSKQMKFLPGLGTPIRPPTDLAHHPGPVTIVVLAWNYPDEIKQWILNNRIGNRDTIVWPDGGAHR